jgi:hypothetical protein
MTTTDSSKKVKQQEHDEGFPIQATLLLGVLGVAVLTLILKAAGVF